MKKERKTFYKVFWRWRNWQWIPFWRSFSGMDYQKTLFCRIHYGPLEIRRYERMITNYAEV